MGPRDGFEGERAGPNACFRLEYDCASLRQARLSSGGVATLPHTRTASRHDKSRNEPPNCQGSPTPESYRLGGQREMQVHGLPFGRTRSVGAKASADLPRDQNAFVRAPWPGPAAQNPETTP